MIPTNFTEWKHCIEVSCGIAITAAFASKRIAELSDDNNQHTMEFVRLYGDAYRQQVINWFTQSVQMQNAQH
jgi:hypothetical protein